jgi:hypothetical protein
MQQQEVHPWGTRAVRSTGDPTLLGGLLALTTVTPLCVRVRVRVRVRMRARVP